MHAKVYRRIPGWQLILVLALLLALLVPVQVGAAQLDPSTIPKWVNVITGPPPVYVPTRPGNNYYEVTASQFQQQILPTKDASGNPTGFGKTTVYGYGGLVRDGVTGKPLGFIQNAPGPTFEATKGAPIRVKYINNLQGKHLFAVDPTLMWASPDKDCMLWNALGPFPPYPPGFDGTQAEYPSCNAQSPIPISVHLHGGEVPSTSDGGPDAWFTASGKHGNEYYTVQQTSPNSAVFAYPNSQQAATLWYHDHALGITRLNVMGGMAGFYLLRDPMDTVVAPLLPKDKYEVPLAIQDRIFDTNGQFVFPVLPTNPDVHPYWGPEFFGNTIMVNGLVWPRMDVDRAAYRFRILDGSNARFYDLKLSNGMDFNVIGVEGGFLKSAVKVKHILIAPGERFDVIVDFSALAPGTEVILQNTANAPYPGGVEPDANTNQIMKFVVGSKQGRPAQILPASLNPTLAGTFPNLPTVTKQQQRQFVLTEIMDGGGPLMLLLNGQRYDSAISEQPKKGTTEEWIIANPTADNHPIHLHLVQFQVVKRQSYNYPGHYNDWVTANQVAGNGDAPPWTGSTVSVDVTGVDSNGDPYLYGSAVTPSPEEQGWKDTVKVPPGSVTWIRARFAPQDGSSYPFDPTVGYYVWHCHIIDHEDNEMMRPYRVKA